MRPLIFKPSAVTIEKRPRRVLFWDGFQSVANSCCPPLTPAGVACSFISLSSLPSVCAGVQPSGHVRLAEPDMATSDQKKPWSRAKHFAATVCHDVLTGDLCQICVG